GPPPSARDEAELQRDNCAFVKVEHLASNIGYVKLDGFADARVCAATATAAMGFLAYADAIIFDLRDNHGGDPYQVAHLASYLFETRTHLNDLFDRRLKRTTQFWTKPDVPGRKLAGKPVFVLTSKHTFSAAEEFTYDLQNLKRATIVGETTGGGAHPVAMRRIDDHFAIGVPYERPVNPVTKTDWEGKGVVPDVKVPADQALATAQQLAGQRLRKEPPRPRRR
ncbi:MAG TPA: S41 family peptidase, partial [Polyangia bacterium]|nr:S41 family peptidase [Polyangia bacterium]